MAQKPKSQSINQNFDSLQKEKQKKKKDISKLESKGVQNGFWRKNF